MKLRTCSLRLLLVLGLAMLSPALARAGTSISVAVKKIDTSPKTEKPDPKKKGSKVEVDKCKLEITLRNGSGNDANGLTVNYYFFTHSAGDSAVDMHKKGTATADLAAGATKTIESEEATAEFTPAYKEKGKRVHANGNKFSGYGVQVMSGDTVVGEFFSTEACKKALAPEAAK